MQWSIVFVVLSAVHIYTTNGQCPPVDICPFVACGNGTCVQDATADNCIRCRCDIGYEGKYCDRKITGQSACNAPCQNNGRCEEIATNVFVCICPSDFTGSQCETSILATHVCVTAPATVCRNGGTCTVNGAGFLCSCPAGYTGTNCETQNACFFSSCTPGLCGVHGNCTEIVLPSGLGAVCECENSYSGCNCETYVGNTCPPNYCQNGGMCQMNGNAPFCQCPATHIGVQCEISLTTLSTTTSTTISSSTTTQISGNCAASPCMNGGSCYNTGNSFICLCKTEYTGPTCGSLVGPTTMTPLTTPQVYPCTPNPCQNGGSCYRHGNSFVCVCPSFYAGATCELRKTSTIPSITTPTSSVTCVNQPCQNGGTCYTTGNSYFCYCGANFSGRNCESPKVASDPSCPLDCSPGYCIRTGGSQNAYACMCNGAVTPSSCSS